MIHTNQLPSGLVAELLLAGVEVTPNKSEIPELESYIDPIVETSLRNLKELLIDWYIIKDTFKNDDSRAQWRRKIEAKYGETFSGFYERNKLRDNWRTMVYGWLETIGDHLKDEMALTLSRELFVSREEYRKMTLVQRITLVNQIESAALDYIYNFAPSYTLSRN